MTYWDLNGRVIATRTADAGLSNWQRVQRFRRELWLSTMAVGYVIGIAILVIATICAVLAAIILPIRDISHRVGVGQCHIEARQFERPTKFVDVNFFTWDCYVQLPSGTWIQDGQYRGFAK